LKNFLKQLGDSPEKKRNISANVRRIIRSGEMMTLSSDRHFGYATVVRSFAKHSWRSYAPHIAQNERSEILRNVSAYLMFAVA